jgi:hypothetical protein
MAWRRRSGGTPLDEMPLRARMMVNHPGDYNPDFVELVGYCALDTHKKPAGKRPPSTIVDRLVPRQLWEPGTTFQKGKAPKPRSATPLAVDYDADTDDESWVSEQAGKEVADFSSIVEEYEGLVSIYLRGKHVSERWCDIIPDQERTLSPRAVLNYLESKRIEGKLKFVGAPFMSAVANCDKQPVVQTVGRKSNKWVGFRSRESPQDLKRQTNASKRLRTYGASGPAWKPGEDDLLAIAGRPILFKVRRSVFIREEPYVEHFNDTPAFLASAPKGGHCWKPVMTYIGIKPNAEVASLLSNPTTADLSDAIRPYMLWEVKASKKLGGKRSFLKYHHNCNQRLLQRTSGYFVIGCKTIQEHSHFMLFDAFRGLVWDGYDRVVFIKESDHATKEAATAVFTGLGVHRVQEIKCVLTLK